MSTRPRIALATLTETRTDFQSQRSSLVDEEVEAVGWLEEYAEVFKSEIIKSVKDVHRFVKRLDGFRADLLCVHIPVWTEPVLTATLARLTELPVVLLGNFRPETSSIVGILGAGGALDQIGLAHERVFDHRSDDARRSFLAFIRAAVAVERLKGQTLGIFGGRSMGMITATADPSQWQRIFGVDIDHVDQLAIVEAAKKISSVEAARHTSWILDCLGKVEFGWLLDRQALERQIRSYLATKTIAAERGYDFVGVKCQPELSDGYALQCVSHMLLNGCYDADGKKQAFVHACEADADGALTMQILNLVTGGKPVALLDVRWYDRETGVWVMANCGALPAAFAACRGDATGLSQIHLVPHVFGRGGGGAFPFVAAPQQVTLTRLCRQNGEYWMAIVPGIVEQHPIEEMRKTTAAFPQAFIKTSAGMDFLNSFGSNHLHMVGGDVSPEILAFCRLAGITSRSWK